MKNGVFISYAREDSESARRLSEGLKADGFSPWLDTENLLPGQNWATAIREAIREASAFIALLSNRSLNKRGFVHKEMRIAFEVLDELPDSDIYFIPARLDNCDIKDERLQSLHCVDLFDDFNEGTELIIKALSLQAKRSTRINSNTTHTSEAEREYDLRDTAGSYNDKQLALVLSIVTPALALWAIYGTWITVLIISQGEGSDHEPYKGSNWFSVLWLCTWITLLYRNRKAYLAILPYAYLSLALAVLTIGGAAIVLDAFVEFSSISAESGWDIIKHGGEVVAIVISTTLTCLGVSLYYVSRRQGLSTSNESRKARRMPGDA